MGPLESTLRACHAGLVEVPSAKALEEEVGEVRPDRGWRLHRQEADLLHLDLKPLELPSWGGLVSCWLGLGGCCCRKGLAQSQVLLDKPQTRCGVLLCLSSWRPRFACWDTGGPLWEEGLLSHGWMTWLGVKASYWCGGNRPARTGLRSDALMSRTAIHT